MQPQPDVIDLEELIEHCRLSDLAERSVRPEPEDAKRAREPEPKVFREDPRRGQ